ncbi:MAG: hypothetical protein FD163_503 [Hyphomonadaceae bacterium]|nr:MAG: hypothetical protein FD128_801 [Hyphomonadaceae bacterium]KAF0187228.1 MAG: hypothetical protein FD163_503 [Hyphomonadaceae bacterium]
MESLSLDISRQLLEAGDVAFFAGIVIMAIISWSASQEIDANDKIAMQWNLKGKAIWRSNRRFGLLFAPIIAAITGIILSFLAHGGGGSLSLELLNLSIIRVGVAIAFILAHILHLGLVLREIKSGRK